MFGGTYSLVSQPLLELILPEARFRETKPRITTFESKLPHHVVEAARILEPELGGALLKFEGRPIGGTESMFESGLVIRGSDASNGILYTCTCGHGPFKVGF
jgi:hypothetical protein